MSLVRIFSHGIGVIQAYGVLSKTTDNYELPHA